MKNRPSNLPQHLGGHGYVTHLDESNLQHIKRKYDIQTMIDIGCGPGGMIRLAENNGISAQGIDGDFTLTFDDIDVTLFDFTTGTPNITSDFDLAWSVEFVEHVKEQYVDNYMKVFQRAKYVLMTHAPETAINKYHFNLKNSSYWVELFESYGFVFDQQETEFIRKNSSMKREFIRDCGHFFINTKHVSGTI